MGFVVVFLNILITSNDKVFNLCIQVTHPAPPQHVSWSPDELPRTVACTIHQGSTVTSMDFHPSHQTLLAGKINANHHLSKT